MARLPLSYTWRNLFARRLRNGLTVAVIGLVVVAVSLIMVVVASLQRTLTATGSDRNLVVLRDGATSDGSSAISLEDARTLRFLEGIAVGPDAAPLAAPELVVQLPAGPPGGAPRGLTIRGVGGPALDVHGGVRIARGRMLRPSSGEAVVGRAVVDVFGGLPAELRFGRGLWKVVGVLESGGSAYESEIWVDAHDLAADGRRLLPYSSIHLRVAPGVDPEELSRRIETDSRFDLTARIESDYYAEQADSASAFYAVIFALAGLGGLGAARSGPCGRWASRPAPFCARFSPKR